MSLHGPKRERTGFNHMKTIGAQTGNVFLAYKNVAEIDTLIKEWKTEKNPEYDFTADDNIQHTIWIVNDDEVIEKITTLFPNRCPVLILQMDIIVPLHAAKVKAAMGNNATENADYFLTTLFPSNQLQIMDYNRVIKDLNGLNTEDFIAKIGKNFTH